MLEQLLKFHWPISAVLSDETITKQDDRYLDLTTEQWRLAENLIKVLEAFYVATTYFSYGSTIQAAVII